ACHPGAAALPCSPWGGIGRSMRAAAIEAANVQMSAAYAHLRPELSLARGKAPRINPATRGPTIRVVLNMSWLRARAAGSCSRVTRFGTAADRAGALSARMA